MDVKEAIRTRRRQSITLARQRNNVNGRDAARRRVAQRDRGARHGEECGYK